MLERSIAGDGSNEIEIRKSRFMCSLRRVCSEDEAQAAIEATRTSFRDADHHCTAWRIGAGGRIRRSSDDGEPSGSAGAPMLEVLNRRNLTDLVAIVTRYFGGTKLGAGGLIRAYGAAVSAAIDHVGIVERRPFHVVTVAVSHEEAGRIEHALRAAGQPLLDVAYNASDVAFTLHVESDQLEPFEAMIAEQTAGRAEVQYTGMVFVEFAAQ